MENKNELMEVKNVIKAKDTNNVYSSMKCESKE